MWSFNWGIWNNIGIYSERRINVAFFVYLSLKNIKERFTYGKNLY